MAVAVAEAQRRGRGPSKPYPPDTFKNCLVLARAIRDNGLDDSIRRVTVLRRLDRQPDSRASRDLVTNSNKYGLTTGGNHAETVGVSEEAKSILNAEDAGRRAREGEFDLAIDKIPPFKALYERMKDKRIPALDVVESLITGVSDSNKRECASIFLDNARYIGLVYAHQGVEQLRSIEETIEELGTESSSEESSSDFEVPPSTPISVPPTKESKNSSSPNRPTIHLDINIHIGADTPPEVIDQVFASMGRHIYDRE